jgi:hypothetical protein
MAYFFRHTGLDYLGTRKRRRVTEARYSGWRSGRHVARRLAADD